MAMIVVLGSPATSDLPSPTSNLRPATSDLPPPTCHLRPAISAILAIIAIIATIATIAIIAIVAIIAAIATIAIIAIIANFDNSSRRISDRISSRFTQGGGGSCRRHWKSAAPPWAGVW